MGIDRAFSTPLLTAWTNLSSRRLGEPALWTGSPHLEVLLHNAGEGERKEKEETSGPAWHPEMTRLGSPFSGANRF